MVSLGLLSVESASFSSSFFGVNSIDLEKHVSQGQRIQKCSNYLRLRRRSLGVSGVFLRASISAIFGSRLSGSGLGDNWKLEVRSSCSTSASRVTFRGVAFMIDRRPPSQRNGVAPFRIGVAGGRL